MNPRARARAVLAVVLPSFRVALVRARSPDLGPKEPLAVVVHSHLSERNLGGSARVDDASAEARARGVLPGDTVASARAKCPDLRVRVLKPREATAALESLAEMLLGFGTTTSPLLDRDAVVVDVTGCAHLHGGEENLVLAVQKAVRRVGLSCRVVLGQGPEMALALAQVGRSRVVRPEEAMDALGALPIDVLRLEPRTTTYFQRLGLTTLAHLRTIPRASLTARAECKNLLPRVRALLDGVDDTPIERFVPETVLEERALLEWGIEAHEALFFVLRPLCDRLAARLEGRGMLASSLEVVLELDPSCLPRPAFGGSADALAPGAERVVLRMPLASPLRKSAEILGVLRARFEREEPLAAPLRAVLLRAPELAPSHARTRHLFEPESRAELALPKLVAELALLLGDGAVGRLSVLDDWRYDHRSVLVPLRAQPQTSGVGHAPEPLRLGGEGQLLESLRYAPRFSELVMRQEHVAWWRNPGRPEAPGSTDWKLVWTGDAFAFVEDNPEPHIRGFLD